MAHGVNAEEKRAIGERITLTRLACGFTVQAEFARHVGISPQALNNYERGYNRPELEAAMQIVQKTGVTLDWIYYGDRGGLPSWLSAKISEAEKSLVG